MWRRLTALFVLASSAFAQHAPLPNKVVVAKTAFLSVQTTAKDADVTYRELSKWNRWHLVDAPEKADLVILITNRPAGSASMGSISATTIGGYTSGSALSVPITIHEYYLHVIDRETGAVLWTVSREERLVKSRTPRYLVHDLQRSFH